MNAFSLKQSLEHLGYVFRRLSAWEELGQVYVNFGQWAIEWLGDVGIENISV